MKSLKKTIFESIIFFASCALIGILYMKDLLPNLSEGVEGAIPSISLILAVGLIFVVLICYLKYREIKYNPEAKEIFEIHDTDERNIYLQDKANSKVYNVFNIIELPIGLILLFTGFDELGVGLIIYHFIKEGLRFSIYKKMSKEY